MRAKIVRAGFVLAKLRAQVRIEIPRHLTLSGITMWRRKEWLERGPRKLVVAYVVAGTSKLKVVTFRRC